MKTECIEILAQCVRRNEPVALLTVLENKGSSPGKPGAMMTVHGEKSISGTIGGGSLELQAIDDAIKCLATGESREIYYGFNDDGEPGMSCGGDVRVFIKTLQPSPQLVIVGAGHIGLELYQLGVQQGLRLIVIDDREELVTKERFPAAKRTVAGDIPAVLRKLKIVENCYITIGTRSHDIDRLSLEAVVDSDATYVGMIGNRSKIKNTFKYLLEQGVSRENISKVYAPMGLDIASIQPKEIAMSIMSEILLVKNGGTLEHMRVVKHIQI